jgi:chromosome segregation ATPase
MNNRITSQEAVGSIDDLEKKAKAASDQLSQATSRNAVWDKAAKAIKPSLANLDKIRTEAGDEATKADELVKSLEGSYDSDVSKSVRKTRDAVDAENETHKEEMSGKQEALKTAKDDVDSAKKALDESAANFEAAQKELMGISKSIQDQQKLVMALEKDVQDADSKHQLVEAVVKLEDLRREIKKLKEWIKPEFETKKWTALNAAADDLIQKTDALPAAQAKVPSAEEDYKKVTTKYEDAVKNRIDSIKQRIADNEMPAKEAPSKPSNDAVPLTG